MRRFAGLFTPTLTALGIVSLVACGSAAPPVAAPSGAAPASVPKSSVSSPAREPTKVTVGLSSPTVYSAPVYAALDEGLFKKEGLDVQLPLLDSATLVQSVVSGGVQFAPLASTTAAVNAITSGADLKMVASVNNSSGILITSARDIKTMAELRGKTLAIAQPLSVSDLAARLALKQAGLAYNKDVHILSVGNVPAAVASLEAGKVQAASLSADAALMLQAQGYNILANLAQQHLPLNEGATLVKASYARAYPGLVTSFIKALWEGTRAIDGDYGVFSRAMNNHLKGQSSQQLKASYQIFKLIWSAPPNPRVTREGLKTILEVLAAANPKTAKVTPQQLVDNTYIEKLKAQGFFRPGECQGC